MTQLTRLSAIHISFWAGKNELMGFTEIMHTPNTHARHTGPFDK